MGIPAILAAAVRQISWGEVANVALKYGPDIARKIKERLQAQQVAESEAAVTADHLTDRIRELESALVRQGEVIEQQGKTILLLEEIGKTLQARVNVFMGLTALSLAVSTLLCLLLLRN